MTAEELEAGKDFGRYLDVDGDGIPYRTYPGTHPTKGAFFTRGTSRDRYAKYTEEGAPYVDNMQRLLRKFETAKDLVPRPLIANAGKPTKYGVIYFGSTAPAMDEAIAHARGARPCARPHAPARLPVPFQRSTSFIADHDFVFVVEQNRDAQMRSLIVNECGIDPARLVPILHYDGTPITARFIAKAIGDHLDAAQGDAGEGDVMTYLAKPKLHHPGAAEERARLHPPRLRRHGLDAVRRLRPRLDHRRDHPGLLRAVDRAAPGRQDFRHRLLVEDADLFPRQFARLQFGAWPHAVGADRRQSRQPRPDLSRRVGRRRLRLDRPRPVRALRCGAASTWSISSRTTACTA